jgi:putative phage-type endonuclease
MRVINCEQGSPEWLHARCGLITASRMVDVLGRLKKGGESQKRADYRTELIAERLTGRATERYVSRPMQWGIDNEPLARAAYEVATGTLLNQFGFVLHPTLDYSGASPDGITADGKGGAEFKCPESTTHIEYILAGVAPEEYIPQMMWEMACCELEYVDFCSFDPRMPENLQLFTVRLWRDDDKIAQMTYEVEQFDGEIQAAIARLNGLESLEAKLEKMAKEAA